MRDEIYLGANVPTVLEENYDLINTEIYNMAHNECAHMLDITTALALQPPAPSGTFR